MYSPVYKNYLTEESVIANNVYLSVLDAYHITSILYVVVQCY